MMRGYQDVHLRCYETDGRRPGPFPNCLPLSSYDADCQARSRYSVSPGGNCIDDEENNGVNAVLTQGLPHNKRRNYRVKQNRARPQPLDNDRLSRPRSRWILWFSAHGNRV